MTNIFRVLFFLEESIRRLRWDSKKMRSYQNKRLRAIVDNAYHNTRFYNSIFKASKLHPSDIRTVDDLQKIPVIKKSVFKSENPANLVSQQYDINQLKIVKTSGSTGNPFQVYINNIENEWRKAIYMRANISCGQKPLDKWAVITAPHHFSDTTGLQRTLGMFSQTCISVFDNTNTQIATIKKFNPDILDGYSGSILLAAKSMQRGEINPRIIFGSAELIDESSRKVIENKMGAPFLDQFGCAEIDRSAWQCPARIGYHMDIDSVITEFVDSDGVVVASGEKGEVVYTSLFNNAMPIIRYNVGDVGEPSEEHCVCGRQLPLMKVVEGRKDSYIKLGDKLLSPRMFTNAISLYHRYTNIEQFRILQKNESNLIILIKKKEDDISEKVIEDELPKHIRGLLTLDESTVIKVEFRDEIPIEKNGKHKAILSEIDTNRG